MAHAEEMLRQVLSYHRRTKHHLHRYAASAGYLDWANQPDPFRSYADTTRSELPLVADALTVSYDNLYPPDAVAPRPLDQTTLAILFELALGLSAWKQYQTSRWALRCNPSSGNLHPTEGYAIIPNCPGLDRGCYHYLSFDHALEKRATFSEWPLPTNSFLIGLSSIHWREAWKYGERAFRYCQHDIGHAIAAFRFAAATLGWKALIVDPGDSAVASLLGLAQQEAIAEIQPPDREHADTLLIVGPSPALPDHLPEPKQWQGKANSLSKDHAPWDVIDLVAEATYKPNDVNPPAWMPADDLPALAQRDSSQPAATLIRNRRSCLALDGSTTIDVATFYQMMDRLLPRRNVAPWDAIPWKPHLHPAIFVHRVDGLPPGLYFLEREPGIHDTLVEACRDNFSWERPDGCPEHLQFYLLKTGDFREIAKTVSCHQDIAADGCFAMGMIAAFGDSIRHQGPWWYRRLFWESGILGQVLYLEAEAAGIRSTGIGCYFDDAMHEVLGLKGDIFQSLYHFTVGGPIEDTRLQTSPAYAHLNR